MQAILTSRSSPRGAARSHVRSGSGRSRWPAAARLPNRYRANVAATGTPATVLVAKRLIPQGTPGTIIASQGFFELTRVPKDQLKIGAIDRPGDRARGANRWRTSTRASS